MSKAKVVISLLILVCILASQVALAQISSDDRLIQLIEKKATLNQEGKDLDKKESDEYEKLASQKGFIGVAELHTKVQDKSQAKTGPQPLTEKQKNAPIQLSGPAAKPGTNSECKAEDSTCEKLVEAREASVPSKSVTLKEVSPSSVTKTDLFEQKDMGAANAKQAPVAQNEAKKDKEGALSLVRELPKKKEISESIDPTYSKRMKKEVADISEMRRALDEAKATKPVEIVEPIQKAGAIYDPVPSSPGVKQNGFYIERDSQTIITRRVGPKDAITVKMCIAYGVSITLDETIDTELQRVILDDKIFFDAQEFENKRGVYVRLLKPIPDGQRWDSAIRLVRKSDDKAYIVNLQAVACPEGQIDYPKVVYLKDKFDVLSARSMSVMTPEDMIIEVSQGLPRKNVHKVNVYDMVASPGSDFVVFGVEVQPDVNLSKTDKVDFSALDNLQINKISVKSEFLKLQSEKASELRGKRVYRFKVMMSIDKNYVLKNRYVHLVYLNKETGHYQYIQIDTLQYFQSLKDRGFDL